VLSPFVSASALTAVLLAAALAQDAPAAGRVLVIVFLAVTIAIGGWLTGQWMTGGIDPDSVQPGHFLPTAAGGLIGATPDVQPWPRSHPPQPILKQRIGADRRCCATTTRFMHACMLAAPSPCKTQLSSMSAGVLAVLHLLAGLRF
jgi:hypothetical protein